MQTSLNRRTVRLVVLGLVALIALVAWVSASAQSQPPFLLYGEGEAGDTIVIHDAEGEEKGATTVSADGTWHVNVQCTAEEVQRLSFTVNGANADAEIDQTGEDQASVTLTAMADSDGMMMPEDDELVSEDGEMMAEGEEMSEDDSEMMESDEMEEDQMDGAYPESGSGGLANEGPSTAALIGTLLVLAALALGLGVWRVRRRT